MCCALVSFHSTEDSARGQPHNTSSCHHEKPLTAHSKAPTLRPTGHWSLLFMSKIWGLNRLTESHGQNTADDTQQPQTPNLNNLIHDQMST